MAWQLAQLPQLQLLDRLALHRQVGPIPPRSIGSLCTPRARHRDSISAPPGSCSTPPASSVSATRRSAHCRRRCQPRGAARAITTPPGTGERCGSASVVRRPTSNRAAIVPASRPVCRRRIGSVGHVGGDRHLHARMHAGAALVSLPLAGSMLTEIYLWIDSDHAGVGSVSLLLVGRAYYFNVVNSRAMLRLDSRRRRSRRRQSRVWLLLSAVQVTSRARAPLAELIKLSSSAALNSCAHQLRSSPPQLSSSSPAAARRDRTSSTLPARCTSWTRRTWCAATWTTGSVRARRLGAQGEPAPPPATIFS
jgi:hypothetical protein